MKVESCTARFNFINLNKKEMNRWVICDTLLFGVEEKTTIVWGVCV